MPILVRPFFLRVFGWLNEIHSHIDSDFNFLLGFIHPSVQINHLFLFMCTNELNSPALSFIRTYLQREREGDRDEIDDRIILSENPLNQKFEWLIADMGILLILWKCGNYLHLKWWGDTSNSIGDYNSSLLTMVMMNAMKRGRVQKNGRARTHNTVTRWLII